MSNSAGIAVQHAYPLILLQAHKQAGKSSAAETKLQHNFVKGQVASINTAVIAWEEEIAKQQVCCTARLPCQEEL